MQTNLLKSKLALASISQKRLAELMADNGASIDRANLNLKINGRREFSQSEIRAIINALKLTDSETMDIFFTVDVS
jgi:hypothetical protein